MRTFFEQFAKKRGLNPLDPATWYSTPSEAIYQSPVSPYYYFIIIFIGTVLLIVSLFFTKGGDTILRKFGGYLEALKQLFPELPFDHTNFLRCMTVFSSNNNESLLLILIFYYSFMAVYHQS